MKKVVSVVLVILLVFCLAACGNNPDTKTSIPTASSGNNTAGTSMPTASSGNNTTGTSMPTASSGNNTTGTSMPTASSGNNTTETSMPTATSRNNTTETPRPTTSSRNTTTETSMPTASSGNNTTGTTMPTETSRNNTTETPRPTTSSRNTTTETSMPTTPSKNGTTSSKPKDESEQHKHSYTTVVIPPTCMKSGYTLYKCVCGSKYEADFTQATHAHTFVNGRKQTGGIFYDATYCSNCDMEVFAHGNADGSIAGGNSEVKFYVTGKVSVVGDELQTGNYHIVIYGTGTMPNYYYDRGFNAPLWYDYLRCAKKITVAEGITSISKGAFFSQDIAANVEFEMADSVKTIEADSIYLKGGTLTLGAGVETVGSIAGSLNGVYIPKSVKYFGKWNNNTTYFYAGNKAQFLNINTLYYNSTVTVKTFLDNYFSNDVYTPMMHVYLNAQRVNDRSEYFDTMKEWNKS